MNIYIYIYIYICSHTEYIIIYKLATCISWAVFGGIIGGQHRQVSLYYRLL
jgi:hypothetical protein